MQADAYAALESRLEAYQTSEDPGFVTDPRALDEVAELRAAIGWPAFHPVPDDSLIMRNLSAIGLAGRFLLVRCMQPEGLALDEMLQVTELFVAVYPFAPGEVPGPLREVCAGLTGDAVGTDHLAWHDEAIDLLDEAGRTGAVEFADRAIGLLASAVLAVRHTAMAPYHLSDLGTAWLDRFRMTGRAADLDHAITAHQHAVATAVRADEDRAGHLANYCDALLARFEHRGDLRDLNEALATGRAALRLARAARERHAAPPPRGDDPRAADIARAYRVSLSNLGAALLDSFEHRGFRADLDEAVQLGREAALLEPEGDPARAGALSNLAQILLERFARYWRSADLGEALRAARTAVAAAPARHPARPACLLSLSRALVARFSSSGDLRDLDEAIMVGHELVSLLPAGHPRGPGCANNLGVALRHRHEHTGDSGALDEAIALFRSAADGAPAGDVSRPGFLNNLGNALRSRFLVNRADGDIDESVAVLAAAAALPADRTERLGYLANLASSLATAAEHRGDLAPVEQAIAMLEREADAGAHPLRHVCLASLGFAWLARFEATDNGADLDQAIGRYRQAVAAVPTHHARRPEYQASLGNLLRRRFERADDRATGQEALDHCRSAACTDTAAPLVRALAARDWGEVAAGLGDAGEAMTGLAAAVGLLDQVVWQGLLRHDQERQLGRFTALACDAAAWAIEAGYPERAVELLEQGRGVLLAQALNKRARYHDLYRASPVLAQRLASIQKALDEPAPLDGMRSVRGDQVPADEAALMARRAGLSEQRDIVLGQIRAVPGFGDFLMTLPYATIREVAALGPVVIINVSRSRCDALLVTLGGVCLVPLPALSGESVVRQAAGFVAALLERDRPGKLTPDGSAEAATTALAWLWDAVVAPLLPDLLAACGPVADGQRPRVWWCPTGPLTFLPLHAAGHHDGSGQTVFDHVVSSYAPTLRMLREARRRTSPDSGAGHPLVVALPETPGEAVLRSAGLEARDFADRFSEARQLVGPAATVTAVRRALADSPPWAHFASHGTQDISNPSAGHLRLHDGPLGIAEIAALGLESAELVFLSACETSRGGVGLADEAITLATAFQLAGYRHVIGTLWTISDRLAAGVARDVYAGLARPGSPGISTADTALALDAAIRALRHRRPGAALLWAPYLHIGP